MLVAASAKHNCHFLEHQDTKELYSFQARYSGRFTSPCTSSKEWQHLSTVIISNQKNSELQDKHFRGQSPSHIACNPRGDPNQNLLFASLQSRSFHLLCSLSSGQFYDFISITEYYSLFLGKQLLSTQEQARIAAPVPCPEKT